MTAAAKVVTAYGFETLGLIRLEARVKTRNNPSKRVLEKVGFDARGCSARPHQNRGCRWTACCTPSWRRIKLNYSGDHHRPGACPDRSWPSSVPAANVARVRRRILHTANVRRRAGPLGTARRSRSELVLILIPAGIKIGRCQGTGHSEHFAWKIFQKRSQ